MEEECKDGEGIKQTKEKLQKKKPHTQRARAPDEVIAREWETNKEKRSLVQECVSKRDRENIYLSPDGSVLGVHLGRNEISS